MAQKDSNSMSPGEITIVAIACITTVALFIAVAAPPTAPAALVIGASVIGLIGLGGGLAILAGVAIIGISLGISYFAKSLYDKIKSPSKQQQTEASLQPPKVLPLNQKTQQVPQQTTTPAKQPASETKWRDQIKPPQPSQPTKQ